MNTERTLDVSELPGEGFGPRSTAWWGTLGFMAAEGASLLLCAATYIYLSKNFDAWPPAGASPPDLVLPTAVLLLLLASLIPATWLGRAAHRKDTRAVTRLLVLGLGIEVVLLGLRAFEFDAVHVRWETDAYGSIVWYTLGFHTLLLATDVAETAVFAAIFLRGRVEEKHYSDVADVAFYWRFVVLAWVPLYLLLYLSPRIF